MPLPCRLSQFWDTSQQVFQNAAVNESEKPNERRRPTHTAVLLPAASIIASCVPSRRSAIAIARPCGKERNFTGEHFWARGYAVSTVGFELEQVRQYIREQEGADGTDERFRVNHGAPRRDALTNWVTAFEAAPLIKPPALRGVSD